MSEQKTGRLVKAGIPVIKLHMFDPKKFCTDNQKDKNDIRIGPLATFLCEAELWQKDLSRQKSLTLMSSQGHETLYYKPGDQLFLRYRPQENEFSHIEGAFLTAMGPGGSCSDDVKICYDYRDAEAEIARWNYTSALAFLKQMYPELVGKISTYALPLVGCSPELTLKLINGTAGAYKIALVTDPIIAIAETDWRAQSVSTYYRSVFIAASLHFFGMEQMFQRHFNQMGERLSSASRDFHPEIPKDFFRVDLE